MITICWTKEKENQRRRVEIYKRRYEKVKLELADATQVISKKLERSEQRAAFFQEELYKQMNKNHISQEAKQKVRDALKDLQVRVAEYDTEMNELRLENDQLQVDCDVKNQKIENDYQEILFLKERISDLELQISLKRT
jgi:chromosome segregation ATPase